MLLDRYAHKSATDHDKARSALDAVLVSESRPSVVPFRRDA